MTDFYSDEFERYLIKPYELTTNGSGQIAIRYQPNAEEDKTVRMSNKRETPYGIMHFYSAFKEIFNASLKKTC